LDKALEINPTYGEAWYAKEIFYQSWKNMKKHQNVLTKLQNAVFLSGPTEE